MLCPEVCNFRAPESNVKSVKGKFDQNVCLEKINGLYYNCLVSVILPDTLTIPDSLTEIFVDHEYYKVSNFSICELVNTEFIDNFVIKGNFSALSINNQIDCDDCVSLTPNGTLILSLTKETYQSLGLEGQLSQFCRNTKYRYIVKLDVTSDTFKSGKKNYERVKTCLKKLAGFDVILYWEPPREGICPSSVAKYFHDLNYDVKLCKPTYKSRTDYSVSVPVIDFDKIDAGEISDIIEWLGMFSLDADLESGSPDNFISTYETPEETCKFGQIKYLEWTGFFTAKQIQRFFLEARKCLEGKPWISLHVQGFSDSPVSWLEQEHHFYTNGDNSYVILLNSENYILSTQRCSFKYYNKN